MKTPQEKQIEAYVETIAELNKTIANQERMIKSQQDVININNKMFDKIKEITEIVYENRNN